MLETYIAYNYIYKYSNPESLKLFRYKSWIRSGIFKRLKFPIHDKIDEEIKNNLIEEKALLEELTIELKKSPHYEKLNKDEKRKFDNKGDWMFGEWKNHIKELGFKDCLQHFYAFSSFSIHSNSLDIIQQLDLPFNNKLEHLASIKSCIYIISSSFISDFSGSNHIDFPIDYQEKMLISLWYTFGRDLDCGENDGIYLQSN